MDRAAWRRQLQPLVLEQCLKAVSVPFNSP
jgi:hypothetical protein